MKIYECRAEDVERLEQWTPSGLTKTHARRFDRQLQRLSSYLIAWSDNQPVGSGEIRWIGCDASEVKAVYPDCPELNGLQVSPERLRSRGIGTAIVEYAENMACERGFTHLGLGVADANPRAAALYLRLDYTETGCHYLDRYHYVTDDGIRHYVADPARFLIKPLRPAM